MMIEIEQLKTLEDILNYSAKEFEKADLYYGHGTDNAWDEAVFIILTHLKLPFADNVDLLKRELSAKERDEILALTKKRIKERVPAPYLVNSAWFCDLEFYIDERVLIPRSPIAELINNRFEPWIKEDQVKNILDIGTGSGAIAIACAKAFSNVQVDAVDIDQGALEVAKINVARHQVLEQVNLIESDLFASLENKKYDIIVSNPPYVEESELEEVPKEYQHEPRLALAAGEDGLDIVRRMLAEADKHLTENGILVVEVAQSKPALEKAFPKMPFIWLEFENGGDGVFLLTCKDLKKHVESA